MKNILISLTVFNKDPASLQIYRFVNSSEHNFNFEFLITDNSQKPIFFQNHDNNLHYYHHGHNGGTRQAILNTIDFIQGRNEFDFVIFLDQDTQSDFVIEYLNRALRNVDMPQVYVPIVKNQHDDVISPCWINSFGTIKGNIKNYETAILSGLLLSRDHLLQVGYIPKVFWLDYLDHFLFKTFLPIPCLVSVTVNHNLSVSDISKVSTKRLLNIYFSELAFYWHCMPDKLHIGLTKFIFKIVRLGFR